MSTEISAAKQTQSYLQERLARQGVRPSARLGQNFLVDLNLLRLIVDTAQLEEGDVVLEVGAGTGALTTQLAARARHVVAVEVDSRLHTLAGEVVHACSNVTLLHADALRNKNHLNSEVLDAVRQQLPSDGTGRLKLVANLPYQVATPVIANLLGEDLPLASLTVTIQQELAERMMAGPATKDYGAFSIWVQALAAVQPVRRLPPNVFWPRPAVNSAIVQIVPDAGRRACITDLALFHEFVRRMFLHRRKTLGNTLASEYRVRFTKAAAVEFLVKHAVAPASRPEELLVGKWIELANAFACDGAI